MSTEVDPDDAGRFVAIHGVFSVVCERVWEDPSLREATLKRVKNEEWCDTRKAGEMPG